MRSADERGEEMKDTIYRDDAIKAINCWFECNSLPQVGEGILYGIPSADRPQGDVDAVDIFEREMHNLEQGYITLGEFDERIEPLRHLCYGRPQGEWIKHFDDLFPEDSTIECSVCHEYQPFEIDENYCPNCGAHMKGADDE